MMRIKIIMWWKVIMLWKIIMLKNVIMWRKIIMWMKIVMKEGILKKRLIKRINGRMIEGRIILERIWIYRMMEIKIRRRWWNMGVLDRIKRMRIIVIVELRKGIGEIKVIEIENLRWRWWLWREKVEIELLLKRGRERIIIKRRMIEIGKIKVKEKGWGRKGLDMRCRMSIIVEMKNKIEIKIEKGIKRGVIMRRIKERIW